jgi:type I restriction enzyme S subunit
MNPRFLYYYLLSASSILEDAASGLIPGISREDVLNILILCPPDPEQQAIATIFSDLDRELAQLEAQLAKYRQVKQGMMQELLTGKKRLV